MPHDSKIGIPWELVVKTPQIANVSLRPVSKLSVYEHKVPQCVTLDLLDSRRVDVHIDDGQCDVATSVRFVW